MDKHKKYHKFQAQSEEVLPGQEWQFVHQGVT